MYEIIFEIFSKILFLHKKIAKFCKILFLHKNLQNLQDKFPRNNEFLKMLQNIVKFSFCGQIMNWVSWKP